MHFTNRKNMKWLLVGLVAFLATVAVGTAVARNGDNRSGETTAGTDPAADVLARIGSSRLASVGAAGETVAVEARAADGEADSARSLWYSTVAGAALAQHTGSKTVTRRVLGSAGAVLAEESDAFAVGGPTAFAPLDRSGAEIVQSARAGARSAGARLLSAHYIRLYGGTAEFVVQPDDAASFLGSAGANVATVLGNLAEDHRPYLVTVVNGTHRPLLVIGYTPAVGGTIGQGIGWQAPDTASDAIWGATQPSRQLR